MFSLVDRRREAAGGWVSLVVAGVLVLTACSGSDGPDADAAQSPGVSSSPSASLSPSPSPSPSAVYKPASADGPAENVPLPVMPEEAKVESKEGLIAFARHWYDLVNYGYETGDVEPVKAISGPDCFACQSFYSGMNDVYSNGGWLEGGSIEILSIASEFNLTPEGRRQALMSVRQTRMVYWDGEGRPDVREAADQSFLQIMEATYRNGGWFLEIAEATGK